MAIEKTDAVVLRRTEYSNTSLIVSLYTRGHGRIEVIAKGARRDKSPFYGALDLANHVQVVYYRHAHGTIHTLSECWLKEDFPGLRKGLLRFYGASHVLELVSSFTAPDDRQTKLFDLTVCVLTALAEAPQPALSLLIFQSDLLRVLGYLPVLFECVSCRKDMLSDEKAFFSPLRGGAVCEKCRRDSGGGFLISGGILRKLHGLSQLSPADGDQADVSARELRQLTVILLKYFAFLLERELRTGAFLLRHTQY